MCVYYDAMKTLLRELEIISPEQENIDIITDCFV